MPLVNKLSSDGEEVRKRSKRMCLFHNGSLEAEYSKNYSSADVEYYADETVERNSVVTLIQDGVNTSDTLGKVSDEERNKYVSRIMEFSLLKTKQLAARAFQEDLIGKLPGVVERETLVQAGQLLDASARIYSFRVDVTHTTVYEVRSKLGDENKNRSLSNDTSVLNSSTGDGRKCSKSFQEKEVDANEDDGCCASTSSIDSVRTDRRRKFVEYVEEDLPSNYLLSSKSMDYVEDVDKFLEIYFSQREMVSKRSKIRRAKVGTLTYELNDLNSDSSTSCNDQLYCKATRNADEGSSTGLLMQNALICDNGRKILLHNRNDIYRDVGDTNISLKDIEIIHNDIETTSEESGKLMNDETLHDQRSSSAIDHCRVSGPSCVSVISGGRLFNDSAYLKLFNWRTSTQISYNLTTREMIGLFEGISKKFKNVGWNAILSLLFLHERDHTGRSSSGDVDNCAGTRINNVYLPDVESLLYIFEQTFNWVLFSKRWDSPPQNCDFNACCTHGEKCSVYNYFFAQDSLGNYGCKNHGKLFKPNEVHFGRTKEWAVEKSLNQLWRILEKADVGKEKSLFKSVDLKNLNESIATLCTSTVSYSLSKSDGVGCLLETITEEDDSVDTVVDKTVTSNLREMTQSVDENDARNDDTLLSYNVQYIENVENCEMTKVMETPMKDRSCVEVSTLNVPLEICSIENALEPQLPLSIRNDDSHWNGRPEKSVHDQDSESKKTTLERKRRKKVMSARKEMSKEHLIFDDADDFPLDVLKSKLKRTHSSKVKEESVLCIKNGKRKNLKFTPEVFKQFNFMKEESEIFLEGSLFSKILGKDWCKEQRKQLPSGEDDTSLSSRSSCFLSLFNGVFDKTISDDDLHNENEHYSAVYEDVPMSSIDETDVEDLTTTAMQSCEQLKVDSSQGFFATCKMRQRRVNAQSVKRAIGCVLSNKNLDVIALKHNVGLLENSASDRFGKRVSQISGGDDVGECSKSFSNLNAAEVQMQVCEVKEIAEDPTQDVHSVDTLIEKIHVQGTHTFSSVLAHVPDFLFGRTAEDVNPVDIFCILLHLCNENNLEVLQHHDDHGLILMAELEDFTIINSRSDGTSHKRRLSD